MKILCSGEVFTKPISREMCLQCSYQKGAPPCGFSYPVLKAIFKSQEYDGRRDEIHVSDVNKCLLSAYMTKVDPQPKYVHKLLILWLGIAIHDAIAAANEPEKVERNMSHPSGMIGRSDYIDDWSLIDFKTTRWLKPGNLPYGNHHTQVNLYNAMDEGDKQLFIQYIDMNGPPTCRKCGSLPMEMQSGVVRCPNCGYVNTQNHLGAVVLPVPMENRDELEDWIAKRVEILKDAMNGGGHPDPEPGWGCRYCDYLACEHNENGGSNGSN